MLVLLLLLGAGLPLAIAPKLLFHYDVSPKTILLMVVAAGLLLRVHAIPRELAALWSRRGGRALIWMAALQSAWIAVTTAASSRPWFSLFGSQWRQLGAISMIAAMVAVVLIAGHLCVYPDRVRTLLRITASAGLAASLYGIAQYFDFDPFLAASTYQAHAGDAVIVRPSGTLGHADYFAWWLAAEFFCGIALARFDSVRAWRVCGMACAGCAGLAILLGGTRAALLAIVIGAVAMSVLGPVRIRRRHGFAAVAVACLLSAFYVSPAGTRLRARAAWSGTEPAGGARPLLWRDSLRMAATRPLFGFGPETFQTAFGQSESEDLARQYPDFHHESPHNIWLDALTSMGVPGLLLALAWVALGWQLVRRGVKSGSPLAAALGAAIAASGTAAFFDAAALCPVLLTLLIMAMLTAGEKTDEPVVVRRGASLAWTACAAAALVMAGFAVALAREDFLLARFQQSPGRARYDSARKGRLPGAAEDIYCSRMLLNTCAANASIPVRIECWRVAEQVAAEATNTADDTANAWYNLALFTALPNDFRGTGMALQRASAASPNWFKPHWSLARLRAQSGKFQEALPEAVRAVTLDGDHDPEVAGTLAEIQAHLR